MMFWKTIKFSVDAIKLFLFARAKCAQNKFLDLVNTLESCQKSSRWPFRFNSLKSLLLPMWFLFSNQRKHRWGFLVAADWRVSWNLGLSLPKACGLVIELIWSNIFVFNSGILLSFRAQTRSFRCPRRSWDYRDNCEPIRKI